jgi:hypothetical protein
VANAKVRASINVGKGSARKGAARQRQKPGPSGSRQATRTAGPIIRIVRAIMVGKSDIGRF